MVTPCGRSGSSSEHMPVYMLPIRPDRREGLLERSLPNREKGDKLSEDVVEVAIVFAWFRRMSAIRFLR